MLHRYSCLLFLFLFCRLLCCNIVSLAVGFVIGFVISFFFQAEDGIRDVAVTGVQTCALPIY